MKSHGLIIGMDSCELCKLRKVKCGESDCPMPLGPSESWDKTESSRHVAGVPATSVCASTRKGRSLDSEPDMDVNWRVGSTASKHSYMRNEPD
jgi:hypothetical protein